MKLQYKLIKETEHLKDYRKVNEEFCCNEMEEAFEDKFINFGEYDYYGYQNDNNVNIYHCSPYPEGACWDEMAIKFCPFCGEEIIVEQIK